MVELSATPAAIAEPSVTDLTEPIGQANKGVLDFLFGLQWVLMEQTVFAAEEWLDRTRTETHLFAELVSKMAEAHSASDIKTLCRECGQHQIDFLRRDSDRLFNQGGRMVNALSNLVGETQSDLSCGRG